MISKETIISSFDDKETLLKWLKKVESALTGATLTNLVMTKLSDVDHVGTYQITATFGDSTSVVSDTFTLPSVDIVTAFSNLTTLVNGFNNRITTNENNVGSILDIIDIANDQINAYTLQNSINGSDDIIVDVDETNEKLEIHLSAELQAKLARVLLLPLSTPSTRKVVTIDTNGAQDNVDGTELTTLMGNIVDSHGNARFIDGDIPRANISYQLDCTGTTKYNKYSLSGTHLMIVVAGEIEKSGNGSAAIYFNFSLPEWIRNKIIALTTYSGDTRELLTTATTTFVEIGTDQPTSVTSNVYSILPSTYLNAATYAPNGTTGTKFAFRTQIDLLIDSE